MDISQNQTGHCTAEVGQLDELAATVSYAAWNRIEVSQEMLSQCVLLAEKAVAQPTVRYAAGCDPIVMELNAIPQPQVLAAYLVAGALAEYGGPSSSSPFANTTLTRIYNRQVAWIRHRVRRGSIH